MVECEVVQVHELGLHTQFIGEIKDVKIDEACLDADGHIDAGKLDPVALALGAGGYFGLGALWARRSRSARSSSQKPARDAREKLVDDRSARGRLAVSVA